jgi:hypothetical protein
MYWVLPSDEEQAALRVSPTHTPSFPVLDFRDLYFDTSPLTTPPNENNEIEEKKLED